ncbi:restriction endonuclease subunit S [Komagataeibacter europaeus]|uniref:restriction endonuclease subunit S n=1 Tax=Komagataeibacter europaeus TaxID=33995 RepID=UPI000B3EC599|nr:restriction endonuclease subunit S [Komagataeibacter europaeus]ARW15287.1 Type I site-specific deoxyribonuclease [Komagataeibacter europaeus]
MTIAAQQTYDAYKVSGIDWVGEIPATWEQVANKHLFRLRKTQVGKRSSEYDLLSLTLRGIIKRDMENPEGKFPAEFDTYQEVRPGDFVFCHFDVEETPRTVGLSTHHGMITGAYTVYEPTGDADSGFLYYFYLHADTNKKLRSLYKGLRNTIPKDTFAAFKTPLPPLPEQRAIAAFLDGKCAMIDEAVRIKEEQIRLLAERRQILIQEAVTRGLNPNAPMKDSGIDWIGQIPAHWEILKLRDMGGFQNGISEAAEYFGSGHPFITYGDVFNNEVLPQNASGLAKSDSRAQTLYSVRAGDIFFTRTSEVASEIGIASAATSDIPKATFSGFLIRFRPKAGRIVPEYARFLFRSDYVRVFFAHEVNIVTRASLGQELLKNLPVFAPPPDEQARIATWLEGKTKDLDGAIELKKSQITALREYKTSLINAAVTGKIKVL